MRLILIELVGSHGMSLDSTTLNVEDGEQDLDAKINAAVIAFAKDMILAPGDSIRISDYQS